MEQLFEELAEAKAKAERAEEERMPMSRQALLWDVVRELQDQVEEDAMG